MTIKNKIKNFSTLALIVLAVWQRPPAAAQTPLSNLVFAVGTTWQDGANNQWSYVLLDSSDGLVLSGRRFAVFGKTGTAGSLTPFTQRGSMLRLTDVTAINALLNQSVALGDDLNSLSDALNLMFRAIPGITNQPLAQKVLSAFQVATTSPETDQLLSLMGKGHPGLNRCLGLAFAEQVNSVTTYEVRELDPSNGTPGDVVGRVTVVPGTPVVLPAPGRPFQVVTNDRSDHLRVRLRWGAPPELRRLAPLQFGYNLWRIARTNAEADNFVVNPPLPAQLTSNSHFVRANMGAVMPAAELDLGVSLGGAENPADRITHFFADTGRMTGGAFTDGEEFYYFVTARDILGRDGLVSFGGLARACRRLPPAPPTDLRVENAVLPGSTNQPRLVLSWKQNLNPTNMVTHYWVYRWINPTSVLTNDIAPTNGLIGIVPQAGGTNRNYFLDTAPGALTAANLTNVWYTLRAVNQAACDPLLSPHTAPAWGVLRGHDGPDATTGEVVGSCGTPVVMFQSFATNIINADTQTWNFRLSCVRRDRGIAWVQFAITNIVSGITQVDNIGPVYFPPDDDIAQLNYPLPASSIFPPTLQVGCIVGTIYDQVSAAAKSTLTAPVLPTQQREAVFYAGQLLSTALNGNDPLLTVANGGQTFCYNPFSVLPDASGMVALKFDIQAGTVLLIQALTSNVWTDVAVVSPDSINTYWVSYPGCLVGPIPTFRGCKVTLPLDSGCDQHIARAAAGGPVAPLRVRFRLTKKTREYRVYRRAGDGPLTLFAQGAALYDPANTNKLIETVDGAMPPSPTRLCYFVQLLDNQGHGSPLAFVGCKEVKPETLPRPVMSEPQPIGVVNNPQVLLNWFCPTSGISRFQFKISRVDVPPSSPAPSGFASLNTTHYLPLNTHATYLGLVKDKTYLTAFLEAHMTKPIGPNFGPGPQFTINANVQPNMDYDICVSAVDDQGHIGPNSEVWRFKWTPPVVLATVPWPARSLPPVNDFDSTSPGDTVLPYAPRVQAKVFYNSAGLALNQRYPIGVRIGHLDYASEAGENAVTEYSDEYLYYYPGTPNSGSKTSADPNASVFRSRGSAQAGQPLLPFVLYREQLTNGLFPRVSGDIIQVSPLIERVPWKFDGSQVTIPDRLFAGQYEYPPGPKYYYFFYVRDLQPVQLGAKYRYLVVRFNDKREILETISAGDVTVE